jgi:hypothetical protein
LWRTLWSTTLRSAGMVSSSWGVYSKKKSSHTVSFKISERREWKRKYHRKILVILQSWVHSYIFSGNGSVLYGQGCTVGSWEGLEYQFVARYEEVGAFNFIFGLEISSKAHVLTVLSLPQKTRILSANTIIKQILTEPWKNIVHSSKCRNWYSFSCTDFFLTV